MAVHISHRIRQIISLLLVLVLIGLTLSCVRIVRYTEDGTSSEAGQDNGQITTSKLPVIIYFGATPANINPGEPTVLEWIVNYASEVILDPEIGAVNSVGGLKTITPSTSTIYTLTATNSAGTVTKSVTIIVAGTPDPVAPDTTVTAADGPGSGLTSIPGSPSTGSSSDPDSTTPPQSGTTTPPTTTSPSTSPSSSPPVINSFIANPTGITSGDSTVISWDVDNASTIYLDHGGGYVSDSGFATASPSATTTYTLTATNTAGSVTSSVTVSVAAAPAAPVIGYFTASPTSITAGGSSSLSWSVSGATSVSINNGVGSVTPSGSTIVLPASTVTYTLTATNAAGTVTGSVTITVAAAPAVPVISYFTASPTSITAGGSSTLSWSVSGATSVSINNGVGGVTPSGSTIVSPASTVTYTLAATNAAGTVTGSVTVTVSAAPPPGGDAACELALFNAVNALRTSSGRAALTRDSYIDTLCRQHAEYMKNMGALSHDNSSSRFTAIMTSIPGIMTCGENVLQDNSPCDADAMALLWWGSPGHQANILNSSFTIAGMGIVVDSSGRIWACQIFAGP